jgi:hypothetical protein
MHFFEREYANKYAEKGYKSAFLNQFICKHIGKLTSEKNLEKSSYHLNDCLQFQTKFVIGMYLPSGEAIHSEEKESIDKMYDFMKNKCKSFEYTLLFFGKEWDGYVTDSQEETKIESTAMDYLITFSRKGFERKKVYTHVKNIIYLLDPEGEKEGLLCLTEPYANPFDWNEKLHNMYKQKSLVFTVLQSMSKTEEVQQMRYSIEKYDIPYFLMDTDTLHPIPKINMEWDDAQWNLENYIYSAFADFLQKKDEVFILFFGKIELSYKVHETLLFIHEEIKTKKWVQIGNIGWVIHKEWIENIMKKLDYKKTVLSQLEELSASVNKK